MKILHLLLVSIFLFFAVGCDSVFDWDDGPELPPATTTGENTVGFKVDGKVWRDKAGDGYLQVNHMSVFPYWTYHDKYLHISAINIDWKSNNTSSACDRSHSDIEFYFEFDSSFTIKSVQSSFLECYKDSMPLRYYATLYTDENEHNYYRITKIDTVEGNMIFSGKFRGTYVSELGNSVEITKGRFDVLLDKRE
mgnify:CR=1 FL=1